VSTIGHTASTNANVLIPVIFIGPNIITVGSVTGQVSIFKSGNACPIQILHHNGKICNLSFTRLLIYHTDELVQALVCMIQCAAQLFISPCNRPIITMNMINRIS
jgi:hypothetical protein